MSDLDLHLRRVQRGGGETAHRSRLALRYALMSLVALFMVGPFLWLAYLSVRWRGNIYEWPSAVSDFSLHAYAEVWTKFPIASAFGNSLIVTVMSVALSVIVSSLAAYPLARYDFYGRRFVFLALLSTLMIPFQLYMIPLFLLVRDLRLDNTLTGVVLPFTASAFGIYIIRQYYTTIPRYMEDAARADGAGEFRLWWQVMFPLTKPAVATLAIFTFVAAWSSFLWPLIILHDEGKWTLPVALAMLTGAFVDRIIYLAAGSVIAIAPVILFFLLLQRWFLGGITIGAVKG